MKRNDGLHRNINNSTKINGLTVFSPLPIENNNSVPLSVHYNKINENEEWKYVVKTRLCGINTKPSKTPRCWYCKKMFWCHLFPTLFFSILSCSISLSLFFLYSWWEHYTICNRFSRIAFVHSLNVEYILQINDEDPERREPSHPSPLLLPPTEADPI